MLAKKKTLEHPKACPVKRATYLAKLNHYIAQGFAIVYMDESGFESETMRPFGYAPIGSPCIDRYNWQAKDRTNDIGALYGKTLFALDGLKNNIKKKVFYHWCKFTLIPKLKKKWAQVKFLRQGWMENDLSKLFYDVHPKHNSFVLQ